jgi:hypothetical protein
VPGDRGDRYLAIGLVVGIGVALCLEAAAFSIVIEAPTPAANEENSPPVGIALGIAAPTEAAAGPHHWYNFTVESAAGGIEFDDIDFEVLISVGTGVVPGPNWTLTVDPFEGGIAGTYSFGNDDWSQGGATSFTTTETIVLDSGPTDLDAVGDVLELIGTGPFQGSVSVEIP